MALDAGATQAPRGLFGGSMLRDAGGLAILTLFLTALVGLAIAQGRDQTVLLGVLSALEGLLFVAWGVQCWRVARRRDGWERKAFLWFAATVPLTLVGALLVYAAGAQIGVTPTGNPLESALTLVLYGCLFIGLLLLGFGQAPPRAAWRRAIDAAILAGCLFFILWGALYRDEFNDSSLGLAERVAILVYPFLDAALLTVGALVLAVPDPSRPRGYRFLLAGLGLTFLGDVIGTTLLLQQSPYVLAVYTASGVGGIGAFFASSHWVGRGMGWTTHVARSPTWLPWLPVIALALAMGSAVESVREHGHLTGIQFWTAFTVVGLVVLQLALTLRERQRLARKLEAESAFKTTVLRFISHEMANPLSPLRLQANLLRRGRPDSEAHSWAIVDRSIERLRSLSNDVREMALAETQRLLGKVESAEAGEQVAAAVQSATALAKQRGLSLDIEAASGPLPVRIDRQRFGQVLDNLLSNALKFTKPPGSIHVRLQGLGTQVRVEVIDSGSGMTQEQVGRLFRPFSRLHDESAPGLGLGLYLCRGIMAELQGEIGASSPGPGRGATFWITLPLDVPGAKGLPTLGVVHHEAVPLDAPAAEALVKPS